jgi:hypothetical protein
MPSLAGRLEQRVEAAAVLCMMCGRTVGRFDRGRLYADSSARTILREGRQLRCGYCRGNIYLDVDPTARPRRVDESDWEVGLRRSRSA